MPEFFEEIGEGCLYRGGDGQGLDSLSDCPVRKRNRPGHRFGADTAHISLIEGTEFFQWYGRKSDGMFWPHGKLLRLTRAGVTHLKAQLADENVSEYEKRGITLVLKQVKRHRTR
jgi:hypothetical protein